MLPKEFHKFVKEFEIINGVGIIPEVTIVIEEGAFESSKSLKKIIIPEGVTSVGKRAFYDCACLETIFISKSVAEIGEYAFSYCSGLTEIKVAEDNPVYNSHEGCNAIIETATNKLIAGCKSTIIPDSVTNIGDYAFRGCSG